ncbi:MAG: hypothetical protein PHF84_12035, partial [bacterium]|nr:hypothetical protein [bacterium]
YHQSRYKFFYDNTFNDYGFVSIKNNDYVGQGDFLFNTLKMKDLALFENPDIIYFDNQNNEIYSYSFPTMGIKKVLSDSALFRLSY